MKLKASYATLCFVLIILACLYLNPFSVLLKLRNYGCILTSIMIMEFIDHIHVVHGASNPKAIGLTPSACMN